MICLRFNMQSTANSAHIVIRPEAFEKKPITFSFHVGNAVSRRENTDWTVTKDNCMFNKAAAGAV